MYAHQMTMPAAPAVDTATRVLAATSLFGGLAPEELRSLAGLLSRRRVQRRATLFHQGEPGATLFIIESGTIHGQVINEDGREVTVAVIGANEVVGELSFFDGHGRSMTAVAQTDSRVWALNRDDFYGFVRRYPSAAQPILAAVSEWFRQSSDEVHRRSFASTSARLARRLVELARVHGRPVPEGVLIAARANQSQLAELIGRSRVTVNKTLADFETRGLIQRVGHRIVLRDVSALKVVASDDGTD